MSKHNISGVYQLPNGYWGYRFTLTVNGKKKDYKRTKDEFGQVLKTEKSAIKAREISIRLTIETRHKKAAKPRMTVKEVYREYSETGRSGKAYATIKKQDSLWRNHIEGKFGKRFIDDISVSEVVDYLTVLYYDEGRAYKYVESFLKFFYLIFGQAYSRNYLDTETYNMLCVNKSTRIHMPKMKIDEETDIVIFNQDEIERLDGYFKGTNAETAYLLGKYCGLRINECYGNGKIQTLNSMKYHSRMIQSTLNITFKYHYLRHTYGTRLAELNTPIHILCKQMGHASGRVTERYYLGVTQRGSEVLKEKIESL